MSDHLEAPYCNGSRESLIRRAAAELFDAGLFVTYNEMTAEELPADQAGPQLMEAALSIVARALEKQGAVLVVDTTEAEERMVNVLRTVARHMAMAQRWKDVTDKAQRIWIAIRQIDPEGEVWEEIRTHLKSQDTSSPFGNYLPIS